MDHAELVSGRHSERVLDVVRRGTRAGLQGPVADSWMRCVNDHRLDPESAPHPLMLDQAAVEARRVRLAAVIDSARHEMSTLYQQLADTETAVVITDGEGVILHLVSSPEFAREIEPVGLAVGAVWSEAVAGTNGMGTCLAMAEPVAVRREDHFFTRFTSLTCSAVPVHDPEGNVIAVLDVTSRSALQQQHVLVLLGMTARMIENRLIDRQFPDSHQLHFHSRPEFVHTLHEGRLAVHADGRIVAANRSALFQLGMESPRVLCGRGLDEVFQTTLEDLLERCSAASYHPVVTYRVNGAHRFFALTRRPPTKASSSDARKLISAQTSLPRDAASQGDPLLDSHMRTACRVVARGTPVLLRGETGSGKEVFARAVHAASPRSEGTFVAVNCASIPESLIEAELFGYRAGAFTGAQRSGRRGKVLQADGGTLFLDEIGDMPLDLQARLLRVLDERRVTPLGSEETQAVDFQLLSASHRNLLELVEEGRFREDLYYRLAGIELHLPPLRDRADKQELILRVLQEENKAPAQLTARAERLLMNHPWPGNVRQLRHVLRAAVALADGERVDLEHLSMLRYEPAQRQSAHVMSLPVLLPAPVPEPSGLNLVQTHERQVLLQLLEQHRWNVSNVAKALDVSRNTLYRKLHKLQIPVSQHD
ncbi:sigma-54-dependent Fis family transcriptional regulator [Azohydromonas australica]|uniref:sigma-54-dependent Fis family transcriptional regulator n=1 Tax=Azohydromonas australica TaxID=364039 RepID=UPI0004028D92|nr:sigma-54-dependent Fis family transcriptional regulator [Azohydromonas australica]